MPEPTTLRLYNTLTNRKEPLRALDPAHVTFYTCGPTVYDDAHIGNFRSFLAADLLRRWLESPLCTIEDLEGKPHTGPRTVRHIMNITDVGHMTDDDLADGGGDDKMQLAAKRILEAKKAGTAHIDIDNPNDPRQIADFYTNRFLEDARKLGLKVAVEAETDPSLMPRAADHVEHMKRMIEQLADKGYAYRAGDAVYFDVQKFETYGRLSGNTLDKLKGGAGGRVSDQHQADKHHPADFLLWKSDPTHLMKWPGPLIDGTPMPEGYPGWHIECSAMARELFKDSPGNGDTIDIHSGGEDNIFPHHECERAQSCCATGHDTFARHWLHARFLMVEGEKMSKSKGNFFTPRDLFAKGHDPAAVRLELIKTHYRANANFTEQGLRDSAAYVNRLRHRALIIQAFCEFPDELSMIRIAHSGINLSEFAQACSDDLNVSAALAATDNFRLALATTDFDDDAHPFVSRFAKEHKVTLPDRPLPFDEAVRLRSSESIAERLWGSIHLIDSVLGVVFRPVPKQTDTDIGLFTAGLEPDPAVIDLLTKRRDAKKAKDFAESDRIRDQLADMGYAIKDVAGGKVEVSRA